LSFKSIIDIIVMKNISIHSTLLLLILIFFVSGNVSGNTSHSIILMHPTVNNIKTVLYLTSNSIFEIPNNLLIKGVYHKNGAYDYQRSHEYILKENIKNITLIEIPVFLSIQNIYTENECSQTYKQLFEQSIGVIFMGGPDIPPACYGEETNLLTEITDPYRHYLELSFLFHLLGGSQNPEYIPLLEQNPNYAILGICLGMQTMNVATGGTLIQDIPTEIYNTKTSEAVLRMDPEQQHRNYYLHTDTDEELIWGHFHKLHYEEGSIFYTMSKTSPYIWSSHHQCIGKIGKNLLPVAWSTDKKVIEAVVHNKYPNVLGVQFHPEVMAIFNPKTKLKLRSGQAELQSFEEMFPKDKGYDFHLSFWKYMSKMYFKQ